MTQAASTPFRARYRAEIAPKRYNGWAHFAFTVAFSGSIVAFAISRLHDVAAWEWLTVPAAFLYANLTEYVGHRGPMHHKGKLLWRVYQRHTGHHHRFFTADDMGHEGQRDFYAVLFPPVLVVFFITAFSLPAGLLAAWATTANVAWLFVATTIGYFLNYELLHFAYHQPKTSWVWKAPVIAALARHHTTHHRPDVMTKGNFNITYPIADWMFGTWVKDAGPAPAGEGGAVESQG